MHGPNCPHCDEIHIQTYNKKHGVGEKKEEALRREPGRQRMGGLVGLSGGNIMHSVGNPSVNGGRHPVSGVHRAFCNFEACQTHLRTHLDYSTIYIHIHVYQRCLVKFPSASIPQTETR